MTELNRDGLKIDAQDLASVSPSSDDHLRLYSHNGASMVSLSGGGTSARKGLYLWDNVNGAWIPSGRDADTVDGLHGSGLLKRSGGSMLGALDLNGNNLVDGAISLWDPVNGYVPSASVQGLDTHTGDTANPHSVTAAQAGAIPDVAGSVSESHLSFSTATQSELDSHTGDTTNPHTTTLEQARTAGSSFSGTVNLSGNYLDGKLGIWSSYMTSQMTNAHNGVWVNCAQNVAISDSTFTRNSSSRVTVNRSGIYRITFNINVHSDTTNRAANFAEIAINRSRKGDQSRSTCYTRDNTDGDSDSISNSVIFDLNSGDYVELYYWVSHGSKDHNLEQGQISIEYLG